MAKKRVGSRRNDNVLTWLRAISIAVLTAWGVVGTGFAPLGAGLFLAVLAGGLAVSSPGIGVLIAVVTIALPALAANTLLGIAFLIVGLAAVQYLGADNGAAFLTLAFATAAAALGGVGPVWAIPVIAGYMLGASEGAVAAVVACVLLEVFGVALGREAIGIVYIGAHTTPALVDFKTAPENLLALSWITEAVKSVGPESAQKAIDVFTSLASPAILAVQPVVWGVAAAVAAAIRRPAADKSRFLMSFVAGLVGVIIAAIGSYAGFGALGLTAAANGVGTAAGSSVVLALVWLAFWEKVFPPLPPTKRARRVGMASEDADVDELLRLISQAEDKIATQHTAQAVVMITDMKSFSRMTEEDGSVLSAKTIQRHRDILIPVIERHAGHGKSTGGDGLVAAFESTSDAVQAAIEMQRTLDEFNSSHPGERPIIIRVGLAKGEVVLDRSGRPFIGNALNLSARIMNLADGGQIFVAQDVAKAVVADQVPLHSHGDFELKNIANPIEVFEVLWKDGQTAVDPRGRED